MCTILALCTGSKIHTTMANGDVAKKSDKQTTIEQKKRTHSHTCTFTHEKKQKHQRFKMNVKIETAAANIAMNTANEQH